MLSPEQSRKTPPRPDFNDVPEGRRRNLAAALGRNTQPEPSVRRGLHALDYRFRLHDKRLPGRPHLVFPSRERSVEVRGCFWHHQHGCTNSVLTKTRAEWGQKIAEIPNTPGSAR
jgi:DNA mismatch endonuclease Vsr